MYGVVVLRTFEISDKDYVRRKESRNLSSSFSFVHGN